MMDSWPPREELKQCDLCMMRVGKVATVEGVKSDYWFEQLICPPCQRIINFKQGVTASVCSVCFKVMEFNHTGRFLERVKECRICGKDFCSDCVLVGHDVMCNEHQGNHKLDAVGKRY